MSYAGDKTPEEAWVLLEENPSSVLIDVRTLAEWAYVGAPDLSRVGKQTQFVEWVVFPDMSRNEDFIDQVRECAPDPETPLLFLCRSGVRSVAASKTMTATGYSACYNVLQGFEGDMNDAHHRGNIGGWKVAGLPWVQS
ncbi:MAG: rhodanese-like domain-containing protein [Rhodospirillales bacterium]|jgi:rhodanese-related sulfurtransferase|nr:rhodanese-like domain-containing protein [Rhodospirillales bacterium]